MVIQYKEICKNYSNGFNLLIKNLDFNPGEIVGLCGNNGAGKTTLLKLTIDLICPEKGIIKINETNIRNSELWKEYTGIFISTEFLIPFLTPIEFFYFIGSLFNYTNKKVDSILSMYLPFVKEEVLNQGNKLIRNFSNGNQVKIGIIGALIFEPKIIIFDEPFNGLDPSSQIILKNILLNMNEKYSTLIIVSSHNIHHLSDICTRFLLLEKGKIIRDFESNNKNILELNNYFLLDKGI